MPEAGTEIPAERVPQREHCVLKAGRASLLSERTLATLGDAGSSHRAAKARGRKWHPGIEAPAKLTQAGGGEAAGAQLGALGGPARPTVRGRPAGTEQRPEPGLPGWSVTPASQQEPPSRRAPCPPASPAPILVVCSSRQDSRGSALCPQTSPRPASAQRPALRPMGQALPCGASGGGGGPLGSAPSPPAGPRPDLAPSARLALCWRRGRGPFNRRPAPRGGGGPAAHPRTLKGPRRGSWQGWCLSLGETGGTPWRGLKAEFKQVSQGPGRRPPLEEARGATGTQTWRGSGSGPRGVGGGVPGAEELTGAGNDLCGLWKQGCPHAPHVGDPRPRCLGQCCGSLTRD